MSRSHCLPLFTFRAMLLLLLATVFAPVAAAQSLLSGSFVGAIGPFTTTQPVVIRATVTNISAVETISICPGICVGDVNTYSLGGFASVPIGYSSYFGNDPTDEPGTDTYDNQIVGPLAPGQTKEFVFGVFTPGPSVTPGWYAFGTELQVFAATPERPMVLRPSLGGRWQVIDIPSFTCEGFLSPFSVALQLKPKNQRTIPVKATLTDGTLLVNPSALGTAPPVIDVLFTPAASMVGEVASQLLPIGQASEGNQFAYDADSGQWWFNLSTKMYTAPGTYTVSMQSGDSSKYRISPQCTGTFVRE
jgi:hypothetical protein